MKKINGVPVPEGLSLEELEVMMGSRDMQTFTVACEALRMSNTHRAYEILRQYISHNDLYKRRYVLSVIFDYPEAAELSSHLEKALASEKSFLVGTALNVIIQKEIRVSDEAVLSCLEQKLAILYNYDCQVLDLVERSQANAQRILKLYRSCKDTSIRIALAESLYRFCTEDNHMTCYELFQNDPVPHIRILACRIAKEYQHPDLLQKFLQDKDGHIRKLAFSASKN